MSVVSEESEESAAAYRSFGTGGDPVVIERVAGIAGHVNRAKLELKNRIVHGHLRR